MATRVQRERDEGSFHEDEENNAEAGDLDLEKATIQHEFSSPWDDSDLILVVEDQKLQVHRVILKMASPVFKAMLSSDFKEKDSAEIPLPGKTVKEVVCLLRQIYPQFKQEITLDNVEYLYRLADEYQMKREVEACKNFLALVPKTRYNAIKILALAKACDADEASQMCCEVLREMSLKELKANRILEGLDGISTKAILLPKVEELQQCVQEALPQMLGVIARLLYVMSDSGETKDKTPKKRAPQTCSSHGPRSFSFSVEEIISCESCKATWVHLATCYNGNHYSNCKKIQFDEKIVKIMEKMSCLKE